MNRAGLATHLLHYCFPTDYWLLTTDTDIKSGRMSLLVRAMIGIDSGTDADAEADTDMILDGISLSCVYYVMACFLRMCWFWFHGHEACTLYFTVSFRGRRDGVFPFANQWLFDRGWLSFAPLPLLRP